jgi:hypothetical protein
MLAARAIRALIPERRIEAWSSVHRSASAARPFYHDRHLAINRATRNNDEVMVRRHADSSVSLRRPGGAAERARR